MQVPGSTTIQASTSAALLYSLSFSFLIKLTIKLTVCTAVMYAFLLCLMDTQCLGRMHTFAPHIWNLWASGIPYLNPLPLAWFSSSTHWADQTQQIAHQIGLLYKVEHLSVLLTGIGRASCHKHTLHQPSRYPALWGQRCSSVWGGDQRSWGCWRAQGSSQSGCTLEWPLHWSTHGRQPGHLQSSEWSMSSELQATQTACLQ